MGAGGRAAQFGLKVGALGDALTRNAAAARIPLLESTPASDVAPLMERLTAFSRGAVNDFTEAEEAVLIDAGLCIVRDAHDVPTLLLTHAGWDAVGGRR